MGETGQNSALERRSGASEEVSKVLPFWGRAYVQNCTCQNGTNLGRDLGRKLRSMRCMANGSTQGLDRRFVSKTVPFETRVFGVPGPPASQLVRPIVWLTLSLRFSVPRYIC